MLFEMDVVLQEWSVAGRGVGVVYGYGFHEFNYYLCKSIFHDCLWLFYLRQ